MAWNDRLREPAYTSPSGLRFTFTYEDVSRTFDKKTTGFEFPDAEGTYVQDLGHSGYRYPLRLIFWGDDYDQEVASFESAIQERGIGKLEHPIYGTVDVVPFGSVTRRDDLKTAANQAILEVTFWETIGLVYPAAQTDPANSVLNAVEEFNVAVADFFDGALELDTAIERVTLQNDCLSLLYSVSGGLQDIANVQDDVRTQFDSIVDSVTSGIDILVLEPATLAFQVTQMIQAPARALASIKTRLESYGDLINLVISGNPAKPGNDSRNSNKFHVKDLYVSSYVTGSILSVVNNQFVTKSDALQAAETILEQFDGVTSWRDENYESLQQIDTGEAYQKLQEAVAITAGFLVEISFSLRQERSIVLDRNRTIIDLAGELYGSVDDQLNFLISSNDLSGSEILELPRGREIVYYL